ncbi:T9SS type A sorting domain-containing protein [Jiulongibacter sediminis]|uniref:Secretion system C-terminal sorting domain-containing protein n=1 Tax=Jiulongibacter sediminis TaxID=1605367 RepID=A0A0P7CB20_9BACT|nr:T9SS type A sorting domain-containing protein [Jiulongibacter sediminis]KPM49939.1 hypothetical protein AFM12_05065 [Jiulongibacter sediminis]TBX26975.1 hypothetical protein TK44_05070 [Jiulongibacter sediminis]
MVTFPKLPRSFFIFWAVFLECGFLFAQSIQLNSPVGQICYNQAFELTYSLSGDFDEEEEFVLVRQYTGQIADSLTFENPNSLSLSLTSPASVFLVATKTGVQSNTVQLNPDAYPGLFLRYNSVPRCEGYSTPIEIYTGLMAGDQITWQKDDENISGAFQNIYPANVSGVYTATVLRGQCSYKVLGRAEVKIGEIAKAQLTSASIPEVCEGFNVNLSAALPDIQDLQMQWLYEGDTIAGANQKVFSASETGSYQLLLKQGQCVSESDHFLVNIGHLTAGTISSSPIQIRNGEVTICENMTLQLRSSNYSSRNDLEYYWLKDGEGIPGERSKNVSIHEPGVYRLGLRQGKCESLSEPLTVKTGPIKGINLAEGGLLNFCESKNYTIIPEAQNNDIVRNTFDLSLFKDGTSVRRLNQFFDLSTVNESGDYWISGTFGQEGCIVTSDTLEVNFLGGEVPFKLYSFTDHLEGCSSELIIGNDTTVRNLTSLNPTFQWLRNGQVLEGENQSYLTAKSKGDYSLKVLVDSSCTYISEPVQVDFSDLTGKIISSGKGLCAGQLSTLAFSFDKTFVDSSGNFLPNIAQFEWSKNGEVLGTKSTQKITQSGLYKVNLKQNGCEPFDDSLRIQLTEINTQVLPSEDTLGICLNGGYATLTAIEIANNYQWVNNNLTAVSDSFSVQANRLGSYKVWIEKNGCYTFSDPKFIIEKVELPTATLSGGGEIQLGEAMEIKIDFTGPGPWTFTTPEGNTVTSDQNPYTFEVQPINYTVYSITTVENPCGFGEVFGSAEVTVIVLGTEIEEDVLKVYPNPASEVLKFSATENFSSIEYSLTDINGRTLMESKYKPQGIRINQLKAGIYLLSIKADDKTFQRKVVIR